MGFFTKVKKAYKERQEEQAELKKAYKEEYAKEKAIQESGRRLTAREEARERARAKARAPALSARFATGARKTAEGFATVVGRTAEGAARGVKGYIKEQAKQKPRKGGTDFLGFSSGAGFGGDFFGMQPARVRRRARKPRARQGQIVINVGAPVGTARKKKKRKSRAANRSPFGDWF